MAFLVPATAWGDPLHCRPFGWLNQRHQETNVRTPVYIDYDSFAVLKNLNGVAGTFTLDQIIGSVTQAMEQWNHSASGREFYYAGLKTAPVDNSPEWCGIGIVTAALFQSASQNRSRCFDSEDPNDTARGFNVRLTTSRDSASGPYEQLWHVGDPVGITFNTVLGSGSNLYMNKDMVALLTHEFGHSLNIGHPARNVTSTQHTGTGTTNSSTFLKLAHNPSKPYRIFSYKNIPSFNLVEYGVLAFDSLTTNTDQMRADIWMAPADSNGDRTDDWTQIVFAKSPHHDGDSTLRNFDLKFPVTYENDETGYTHTGGNLLIRVRLLQGGHTVREGVGTKFHRTGMSADGEWGWSDPSNRLSTISAPEFAIETGGFAAGSMGSSTRRDLYVNDVECAEVYYDSVWRLLTLNQTSFTSGSFNTSVFAYGTSSTGGVSAGGANKTPDQFRGSYFQGIWSPYTAMYVDRYTSGALSLGSSHFLPIAPLRIHRRELSPVLRDALIVMPRTAASYGVLGSERWTPQVYQSTTGFDGGIDSNLPLVECTTPTSGFMTGCAAHKPVVTLRRPVGAYDDFRHRTVVAWTHLDRTHPGVAANHDVRVSWGFYNGSLSNARILAPSTSLGVRSDVSPGLACKYEQAGQFSDCMLAYTDISDPTNRIKFRRFYGTSNGQYLVPAVEGQDQTIDSAQWHRTASPIALFYHNSKWWVVFKLALATGSGSLRVYSSTNGLTNTWTYHGTLGYSATGANAIGDWTTSNRVHWAN